MGPHGGSPGQGAQKGNGGRYIRKILFFILLTTLVFVEIPQAESNVPSPWIRGAQSLLLPGLGQFLNRRPVKGTLFVSAAAAGIYLVVENTKNLQLSYDNYLTAFNTDPLNASDEYDAYENDFYFSQYFITGVIVFWLYNALDAFFDAHFIGVDMDLKKKEMKLFMETEF